MARMIALPLLLLTLFSCSTSPVDLEYVPPREPTPAERTLARSAGTFGLTLFRQMSSADPGVNQFISPVSVALALGMTLNGASGQTYDSMKTALALTGLSQEEINRSYKSLTDLLQNTDPSVTMDIANSTWYRTGFAVQPSFIDALTTWYSARVAGLDFSQASASGTMNQWVHDATNGRIARIVPDQIPPETVMYLINALYFKGTWTLQFDPSKTQSMPFTRPDGSSIDAPFMSLRQPVRTAFSADGTTVLELTYGQGHYRMVFMLPAAGLTLEGFVAGLTDAAWDAYLGELSEREAMVYVPKFRMEYERSLKQDLAALGMGIAFTREADFTRINTDGQLYISEVKHKTFVQVDEEGTEAAAATSVEVGVVSMPPTVMLNRPFVFAVRDENTGTIVFIGKMMKPAW